VVTTAPCKYSATFLGTVTFSKIHVLTKDEFGESTHETTAW